MDDIVDRDRITVFWRGRTLDLFSGWCSGWYPGLGARAGEAMGCCGGFTLLGGGNGGGVPPAGGRVWILCGRELFSALIDSVGPPARGFRSDGRPLTLPAGVRPEQVIAFEDDPTALPVYHDWCCDHWPERAAELATTPAQEV